MLCIQRKHLLIIYLFLILVYIREAVGTFRDDYHREKDLHNHFRHRNHHHHHQHIPAPSLSPSRNHYRPQQLHTHDNLHQRNHNHNQPHKNNKENPSLTRTSNDGRARISLKDFTLPLAKILVPVTPSSSTTTTTTTTSRKIEEILQAYHNNNNNNNNSPHHSHKSAKSNDDDNVEGVRTSSYSQSRPIHNKKSSSLPLAHVNYHKSTFQQTTAPSFVVTTTAYPTRSHSRHSSPTNHYHQPQTLSKSSNNPKSIEDDTDDDDYYYYYEEDELENISSKRTSHRPSIVHGIDDNNDELYKPSSSYVDRDYPKWDLVKSYEMHGDIKNHHLESSDDYYGYIDDEPPHDSAERPGDLNEEKWNSLGTPDAVEQSRRRHLFDVRSVSAHIRRIDQEAMCKYPKPKIIQISEASKRYVPHCTVLHHCGDDTGCCKSDTKTCIPKNTTTVDLHFYAITVDIREPVIETLSFINHTECHCVDRSRLRSSTPPPANIQEKNNTCQCVRHFDVFEEEVEDDYSSRSVQRICRCDCLSENTRCELFKKGQEVFANEDRLCITHGKCTSPNCEYGMYNRRTGKCPKMEDKFEYARQLSFDQN